MCLLAAPDLNVDHKRISATLLAIALAAHKYHRMYKYSPNRTPQTDFLQLFSNFMFYNHQQGGGKTPYQLFESFTILIIK